jgi:hypothetical protein
MRMWWPFSMFEPVKVTTATFLGMNWGLTPAQEQAFNTLPVQEFNETTKEIGTVVKNAHEIKQSAQSSITANSPAIIDELRSVAQERQKDCLRLIGEMERLETTLESVQNTQDPGVAHLVKSVRNRTEELKEALAAARKEFISQEQALADKLKD